MTPELWQVIKICELHHLLLPDPKDTLPRLFPEPWQKQPQTVRTKLAEAVNFRLWPLRVCDDPYTATELLEKAERQVRPFEEWCNSGTDCKPPVSPDPMQVCKRWPNGDIIVMLEIGVADYNVKELSNAFREWLNTLPDVRRRQAAKRGKKRSDVRNDLICLAKLRLLHAYTFNDLFGATSRHATKEESPECWPVWTCKQFVRGRDAGKWYAARHKALKTFYRLFPFLPKDEKPDNWQTKGERNKRAK